MTDKEIIKALKICAGITLDACCDDCPQRYLGLSVTGCQIELLKNALDLINRQQAEIERLNKDSKRLKKVQMQLDDLCKMHHIIKAEAYKECIEKVKENSNKTELVCSGALVRTDYTITKDKLDDLLLKEMVGEQRKEDEGK